MKKILLIATGGTIASKKTENGLVPSVDAKRLLELVPEVKTICDIDYVQLLNLDSTNMRPGHWLAIAETIMNNYEKYDGFVITHGTDTMAYTAAGLSYIIQDSRKPIVLTGAQVPAEEPNSDGRTNLRDALIYASDDESCNVQIVFSGSVVNGTRARKNFTKNYAAFVSVNYPEIAKIQDGKIIRFIPQHVNGDLKYYEYLNPSVGLVKLVPGMSSKVLEYILDFHDGVVIESFGVGGLPEYSDFYGEIKKAVDKGKIIVMTTQVSNEGSDLSVYKVGNILKHNYQVLEAHDLTTEAAIAKLMWALGQTTDFKTAESLFYKKINSDMLIKN